MKKIFSFMLIAAGLLVSAQSKAQNVASVTIGDQVTEYATLADAVAYAQLQGKGLIKLLANYPSTAYPQAWVDTCKIDWPTGYDENDKCFFTFHAFNPNNGDEAIGEAKAAGTLSAQADIARFTAILQEVDPTFDPAGVDIANFSMKKLNGYADWHADFEVYFSHDIAAADYTIGGNYADYGWIYEDQDSNPISKDMVAGERIRLLKAFDNNLKYWELLSKVRQFHCGVISLNENANAGKTIYVDLFMYAEGNEDIKILMGTTPYTFPMKPIVTSSEVVETEDNKEIVAELKEENAGVKAMTDIMTNIYPATSAYQADKQKTIIVILTDVKVEVIQGEYESSLESITYNVTPKYIDENGDMQTIPNSAITAPIKFRLPVASKFAGKSVNVFHKANGAEEEDYVGQFQVQELDGSYYIELSASEFSKYIIRAAKNYYERKTTAGMIGTLCVPYDIVADSLTNAGAEFFEINYRNNTVTTAVTEVSGSQVYALEGGKAYVFHATGDLIHVGWVPEAEAKPAVDTSMVGNLTNAAIYPAKLYAAGKCEPYMITGEGVFRPCNASAYIPVNRAYLNMAKVPTTAPAPGVSARRIRLTANGANVTTEIVDVNANVNANCKMMVNGQLIIMKNGKMFNAQGQEL